MASFVLELLPVLLLWVCPPAGCAALVEVEIAPLELLGEVVFVRFASEDFEGFDFLDEGFEASSSVEARTAVALDELEFSHCSGVPRLGEPLRSSCGSDDSGTGGGEVRGIGDDVDESWGGGVFEVGEALAWSDVARRW